MSNEVMYTVLAAAVLSQLLPVFAGKKQNNPVLWYYVITGFCFDVLLILFKRVIKADWLDYHLIGNLYFAVEFLFITFFYYRKIYNSGTTLYAISGIALSIYALTFFNNSIISGTGIAIFAVIYAAYSIAGFYHLLTSLKSNRIEQSQFFWANTGFIIYAAGSLPILIAIDHLLEVNKETAYTLWVFRNILNIIKSIIFAKALTLTDRE